jgi:hypothetical protein
VHLGAACYGPNPIGLRRLISLVKGLPLEARTKNVDGDNPWTMQIELAASTLEMLHRQAVLFLQANSKPGASLPPPLVVPRPEASEPDAKPRKRRQATAAEVAAMLGIATN